MADELTKQLLQEQVMKLFTEMKEEGQKATENSEIIAEQSGNTLSMSAPIGGGKWSNHGGSSHIKKFTRRLIHYVDNAMDKKGCFKTDPQGYTTDNFAPNDKHWAHENRYVLDDGWKRIPYETLFASINGRDWLQNTTGSKGFVIKKKVGFQISDYMPLLTDTKTVSSTTVMTSQFVQKPDLWCFKDTGLDWTPIVMHSKADGHGYTVNHNMECLEPETQDVGKLKRMYFDLGDEFDKTLGTEKCETWDVSTLNGDNDITMIGLGGNYGHEYKPAHRYYPLGIRPYKGTDTDKDHATGAMGSKTNVQPYVNNILPDKLGDIEYNVGTGINQNCDEPPVVGVRIRPLHGVGGPINITGCIIIDYYSEVEFIHGFNKQIQTLNMNDPYPMQRPKGLKWRDLAQTVNKFNMNYDRHLTQWKTSIYPTNLTRIGMFILG